MALKPDRRYTDGTDISFFMNETGEKGEVLVFSTAGSGAAMDDANAVVATPTTISGSVVAGILMNDVVNLDLTRQHINWHKDEVQLGGKVTLLRHGVVVTNVVHTGCNVARENGIVVPAVSVGAPAYIGRGALTAGGTIQGWLTTQPPLDHRHEDASPKPTSVDIRYRVGTFLSLADSDGYYKVEINIP